MSVKRDQVATESPWPFVVGDVVQLKSGGGKMVVAELMCGGKVRVVAWSVIPSHEEGYIWETDLDPVLLHRVAPVRSDEDEIPF